MHLRGAGVDCYQSLCHPLPGAPSLYTCLKLAVAMALFAATKPTGGQLCSEPDNPTRCTRAVGSDGWCTVAWFLPPPLPISSSHAAFNVFLEQSTEGINVWTSLDAVVTKCPQLPGLIAAERQAIYSLVCIGTRAAW